MNIPLHLKPTDTSEEANLARIALHQKMFAITGGKGFRTPSAKKDRFRPATRIEAIGNQSFA